MADLLPSLPGSTPHGLNVSLDDFTTDQDLANVQLFKHYSEGLLRFASVSCVLFMLVGIPGNLITIIALARCKKVSELQCLSFIHYFDASSCLQLHNVCKVFIIITVYL